MPYVELRKVVVSLNKKPLEGYGFQVQRLWSRHSQRMRSFFIATENRDSRFEADPRETDSSRVNDDRAIAVSTEDGW